MLTLIPSRALLNFLLVTFFDAAKRIGFAIGLPTSPPEDYEDYHTAPSRLTKGDEDAEAQLWYLRISSNSGARKRDELWVEWVSDDDNV